MKQTKKQFKSWHTNGHYITLLYSIVAYYAAKSLHSLFSLIFFLPTSSARTTKELKLLYTVAYISDPQLKPTQHENNTYAPWCFVDTCDISVVRCKSERVCVSVCVCVCMKRVEGESCCLSAGPLSNRRETCGGVTHTHTHTHPGNLFSCSQNTLDLPYPSFSPVLRRSVETLPALNPSIRGIGFLLKPEPWTAAAVARFAPD